MPRLTNPPDARQLAESLRRCVCPACGREKKSHKTFCGSCYHQLDRDIARQLYRRIGHGYAEAVEVAMWSLGRSTFILPEASC